METKKRRRRESFETATSEKDGWKVSTHDPLARIKKYWRVSLKEGYDQAYQTHFFYSGNLQASDTHNKRAR